jgi:hypothetical protein
LTNNVELNKKNSAWFFIVLIFFSDPGKIQGTEIDFAHTTISNLEGDDDLLWVHLSVAILLFPVGIIFMRHFSVGLKITVEEHGDGNNDNSVESR